MEAVGSEIDHVLIVARDQNGGLPVPPQAGLAHVGRHHEAFRFATGFVYPKIVTKLITSVYCVVIAPIDLHLHPVAAYERTIRIPAVCLPVVVGPVCTWAGPYAVILQAAIHVVGFRHVDGYGVELPNGGRISLKPGLARIVGDVDSPVIAQNLMLATGGIDPERVVIRVYIVLIHRLV